MKILVTGGSGFIGTYILEHLAASNNEIISIGRTRPRGFEGSFIKSDLLMLSEIEIREIMQANTPTHLLHLAWVADHGIFWESPSNLSWIKQTGLLAKQFAECGGKFFLGSGSCAEYRWDSSCLMNESSVCEPTSLYGLSKDFTRKMVSHIFSDYSTDFCWTRIFFPYGPNENENKLIPKLKQVALRERRPFKIREPGTRDFIHVEDVASALSLILQKEEPGVINICSGMPVDLKQLLTSVSHEKLSEEEDFMSSKPLNIVGDNSKLLSLGWETKRNLLDYLMHDV